MDISWEITSTGLFFTVFPSGPFAVVNAVRFGGVVLVALCEVNDYGKQGEDLWPWNSAFRFAGALQTSRPESCKWYSKTRESNGQFACAKWRRNARAKVPRYYRLYQFTQAFKIFFLLADFLTFLLWLFWEFGVKSREDSLVFFLYSRFFILLTCLPDNVLISEGEFRYW